MFDPSRAIDATFRRFGKSAVLDPDAAAIPVTVIRAQPDTDRGFAEIRVRSQTNVFEIRASEIGGYGKGAVLEFEGGRFRVQAPPEYEDPDRLVAILDTVEVAS